MHETYCLWQASALPWANAPDAEMTIADVSHSKAGFMDALGLEQSQARSLHPGAACCIH
jgi:hypothetical protein